ncbi:hypothetical protein LLH06_04010 [Mucilaginibacter daejeonensis]|uniref:hypothetical protein n=1 Tax=Mucilaginibacter daejeonensis TaxID=398049 RepID=UPI001D176B1E|nr:hypothetical protein [Mucilaginibacter daejeonensis]UEG54134.1 hypothetical protein LLH06_04010 [Mucilaginibacter daejeonensis]
MADRKSNLIILCFVLVVLIPVAWLTWQTSSKLMRIFYLDKQQYVITEAALTKNTCKKYGNTAKFNIHYNGQITEGADGCLLFASTGDVLRIYFNRADLHDNGIVKELLWLCAGRWILTLLLSSYLIIRLRRHLNTHTT